jgi:hypothetical protein
MGSGLDTLSKADKGANTVRRFGHFVNSFVLPDSFVAWYSTVVDAWQAHGKAKLIYFWLSEMEAFQ